MHQILQSFSERLTAMVIGALAAEGIYFWAVNGEMLNWDPYGTALWPVVGAVLGLLVYEDTHRAQETIPSGVRKQVLLWAIGGAVIGGSLGLLAQLSWPHSVFGWLPFVACNHSVHAIVFWGGIGAVLTMQYVSSCCRPVQVGPTEATSSRLA
jgi:hypothetical protein